MQSNLDKLIPGKKYNISVSFYNTKYDLEAYFISNYPNRDYLCSFVLETNVKLESEGLLFKDYIKHPNLSDNDKELIKNIRNHFNTDDIQENVIISLYKTDIISCEDYSESKSQKLGYHPGGHTCECGTMNYDVSLESVVNGKYSCYSCRNNTKVMQSFFQAVSLSKKD